MLSRFIRVFLAGFTLLSTLSFGISLDTSFGKRGILEVWTEEGSPNGIFVTGLTDGKPGIILAGSRGKHPDWYRALMRVYESGLVDPKFVIPKELELLPPHTSGGPGKIFRRRDGNLLYAFRELSYAGYSLDTLKVCLLTASGLLVKSFADAGCQTLIQKANIAGRWSDEPLSDTSFVWYGTRNWFSESPFEMKRILPTGAFDISFGSKGTVIPVEEGKPIGPELHAVVVPTTDGKILYHGPTNLDGSWTLNRFAANGSLDTTFGNGGKVGFPGYSSGDGIGHNSLGTYVLLSKPQSKCCLYDRHLVKLKSNGAVDLTFGSAGKIGLGTSIPGSTSTISFDSRNNVVILEQIIGATTLSTRISKIDPSGRTLSSLIFPNVYATASLVIGDSLYVALKNDFQKRLELRKYLLD